MADQIIHEHLLQRLILFTLQAFLVGLLDGLQTRPRKNVRQLTYRRQS